MANLGLRIFAPHGEAVSTRTDDPRGGMLRETRDGGQVLVGGVSSVPLPPPSFGERMSRAAAVAAFIMLGWLVWASLHEGALAEPPRCVGACADDAPRSEGP